MSAENNLTEELKTRKNEEPILVTYLPAGYPDESTSIKWIKTLLKNGADAVELGYPSQSPEKDGHIISEAQTKVLESGFGPEDYLEIIGEVNEETEFNRIILMGYWEQIRRKPGVGFLEEVKRVGAKNLIFPDLSRGEEVDNLVSRGFEVIPFLESFESLSLYSHSTGSFVYCPTYHGKTGKDLDMEMDFLGELKDELDESHLKDKPHLAGFGISSKDDVEKVLRLGFDGIVVGSAVLKAFSRSQQAGLSLLEELKEGLSKE
jgi:tryptophan synthase alpha chain